MHLPSYEPQLHESQTLTALLGLREGGARETLGPMQHKAHATPPDKQ
eukprot:CAMPEP_0171998276 /NCGR_PEP_ID=MMETSP1041-20130122/1149_1 /TAXON_ID=464988 /ORGANISM="Hemiselmis andersenii, Strain CCMP439" /LENGTH=46 /DNA_ID= /DNA_START= /DNA_END= /DNA_ORIENTATION=